MSALHGTVHIHTSVYVRLRRCCYGGLVLVHALHNFMLIMPAGIVCRHVALIPGFEGNLVTLVVGLKI